eukprot:scaffold64342_cov73-Phaeocystis_antarctica.AAC.2
MVLPAPDGPTMASTSPSVTVALVLARMLLGGPLTTPRSGLLGVMLYPRFEKAKTQLPTPAPTAPLSAASPALSCASATSRSGAPKVAGGGASQAGTTALAVDNVAVVGRPGSSLPTTLVSKTICATKTRRQKTPKLRIRLMLRT